MKGTLFMWTSLTYNYQIQMLFCTTFNVKLKQCTNVKWISNSLCLFLSLIWLLSVSNSDKLMKATTFLNNSVNIIYFFDNSKYNLLENRRKTLLRSYYSPFPDYKHSFIERKKKSKISLLSNFWAHLLTFSQR